jgi:hypothetical protein
LDHNEEKELSSKVLAELEEKGKALVESLRADSHALVASVASVVDKARDSFEKEVRSAVEGLQETFTTLDTVQRIREEGTL